MSEIERRYEIVEVIAEFAAKDPEYRRALLQNPRAIFSRQVGQPLRERQQVKVVEETADTIYLIAPYVGPEIGAELTDAELEQVCGGSKKGGGGGGGGGGTYYICNNNVGVGTRVEISTDVSLS